MQRKAVVIENPALPHHRRFGGCFSEGLRRRGWSVETTTSWKPAHLAVLWGVRNRQAIDAQLMNGGEVCILERGYLGDRMEWTSISFGGGLNGRGRFVMPGGVQRDLTRFQEIHPAGCEPWHDGARTSLGGDLAVIMGQVPGDQSIRSIDFGRWVREVGERLKKDGWRVTFRPHPGCPRMHYDLPVQRGQLRDVLTLADLAVTFNSNSGVDAVLAGVPTVAMDEGSMVRSVAAHDIAVVTPDRTEWAARLAWCQYSREELASGFAQECTGL